MSRAEDAQRLFLRRYVEAGDHTAWFSGVGISHTRVLESIIEMQRSVFGYVVLPVEGRGSFVMVSRLPAPHAPDLPTCLRASRSSVTYGGRTVAS